MKLFKTYLVLLLYKTAADVSVLNCQENFLKYGSKNVCSNVVSVAVIL